MISVWPLNGIKNNHSMKSRKSPHYKTYWCIIVPYGSDNQTLFPNHLTTLLFIRKIPVVEQFEKGLVWFHTEIKSCKKLLKTLHFIPFSTNFDTLFIRILTVVVLQGCQMISMFNFPGPIDYKPHIIFSPFLNLCYFLFLLIDACQMVDLRVKTINALVSNYIIHS